MIFIVFTHQGGGPCGPTVLTWWPVTVEVVVMAVAEGMLEYTLDVVKLEPADRKKPFIVGSALKST